MRLVAAAIAALVAAAPARAQQSDVAAAEALFKEGMALMAKGDYAGACPKLAESQRLDPGVGTLYNLGRCYEKIDRLASAWARYLEAAQEAERRGESRRARVARRNADRLEPRLHRLAILVPNDSRLDGLAIERDGIEVGPGAWGARVPVDAGEVEVSASAPGYQTWTTTVEIGGGNKLRIVEVPPLQKASEPEPEPVYDIERVPGEPWYRDKLGWGLVAGGVALAGGATFALVRAGSFEADAEAEVDLGERDRLFDKADSHRIAGAALIASAVGLAAAGAVRLALTPPGSERRVRRETAELLVGPGAVGLRFRF